MHTRARDGQSGRRVRKSHHRSNDRYCRESWNRRRMNLLILYPTAERTGSSSDRWKRKAKKRLITNSAIQQRFCVRDRVRTLFFASAKDCSSGCYIHERETTICRSPGCIIKSCEGAEKARGGREKTGRRGERTREIELTRNRSRHVVALEGGREGERERKERRKCGAGTYRYFHEGGGTPIDTQRRRTESTNLNDTRNEKTRLRALSCERERRKNANEYIEGRRRKLNGLGESF